MQLARLACLLSSLLLLLTSTTNVLAFSSSSTNFKLDAEFGDFGGTNNSTNFSLSATGGGFAPGFSNSTNYLSCSGFQCQAAQVPTITFTLSATLISLGTLTTGAVNTGSHTAVVTTNFQGYSLKIVQDGNLCRIVLPCNASNDINAVSGGVVTAGTEAYGVATSKSGQAITQDTSCSSAAYNASALTSTPQSVANSTSPTGTSGDTTTICYAASISGATAAGNYSQKVTFIATGTF